MGFFDWFYKTMIASAMCVVILLSCVLVVKYFFKDTFLKAEKFFIQEILSDTKISEVLSDEI